MDSKQESKKKRESYDQIRPLNSNSIKKSQDNNLKYTLLNDNINTFIESLNYNFDFKNYTLKNTQKIEPVSKIIFI